MYTRTRTYTYTHTPIHGYRHTRIHTCTVYIHVYKYTQVHTGTYRYIQVHTGTYRYIQVHTGTYRYIQVHTGTSRGPSAHRVAPMFAWRWATRRPHRPGRLRIKNIRVTPRSAWISEAGLSALTPKAFRTTLTRRSYETYGCIPPAPTLIGTRENQWPFGCFQCR